MVLKGNLHFWWCKFNIPLYDRTFDGSRITNFMAFSPYFILTRQGCPSYNNVLLSKFHFP